MNQPVVTIHQGQLRGSWRETGGERRSAAFLGIPFAEAPVGELRFAAPVRAQGWEGVREATEYGPTPQRRPFGEVTAIPEPSIPGEATLNVNVFTPAPGEDARLPVLVWIHGGGYKAGSPASPWYDGKAFNKDGVVTVTISYRLGFDGFGWISDAPHNRGLLDQISALEWVRDNISAFGGDPDRVTIAGQSAGGGSVQCLLHSPLARGLFRAAISHSGAADYASPAEAERRGRHLAERLGVEATRAGLSSLTEDQILDAQAEMEQVPTPELTPQRMVDHFVRHGGQMSIPFTPWLDGTVLSGELLDDVTAGLTDDIALLAGTTAHEFTFIGRFLAPALQGADIRELLGASPLAPALEDWVVLHEALPDNLLLGQVMTDQTFRVPLARLLDARTDAPTWAYDFRHIGAGLELAGHCAELPFVFDCLDAPLVASTSGDPASQGLADAMHADWVHFITHAEAPWPQWRAGDEVGTGMVYDDEPYTAPTYQVELAIAEALERA